MPSCLSLEQASLTSALEAVPPACPLLCASGWHVGVYAFRAPHSRSLGHVSSGWTPGGGRTGGSGGTPSQHIPPYSAGYLPVCFTEHRRSEGDGPCRIAGPDTSHGRWGN